MPVDTGDQTHEPETGRPKTTQAPYQASQQAQVQDLGQSLEHVEPGKLQWVRANTSIVSGGARDPSLGMPVYAITLPDRLQNVMRFAAAMGLEPVVMRAFTKDKLSLDQAVELGVSTPAYAVEKNHGRLMCGISHAAALLHFLDHSDAPYVFVLEDDVRPADPDTSPSRLRKFVQETKDLNPDPTRPIMGFAGFCHEPVSSLRNNKVGTMSFKMKLPRCTHAFMINRVGASKAVRVILESADMAHDEILARKIAGGDFHTTGAREQIVEQNRDEGSGLGPRLNYNELNPFYEDNAYPSVERIVLYVCISLLIVVLGVAVLHFKETR